MRFGIPITLMQRDHSNKPVIINIDYQRRLLSIMKLGLSHTNPQLFDQLYKTPTQKVFATSAYFPNATFIKDQIILNQDGKLVLFFSTADTDLGLNFYNAFMYLHLLSTGNNQKTIIYNHHIDAQVGKLYRVEVPAITQNVALFKTMSPIVLRDRTRTEYFITGEGNTQEDLDKFTQELRFNTMMKLDKHPELKPYVKDLTFTPIKMKRTIRKAYNLSYPVSKGLFELSGNPALLTFLQDTGLGQETGSCAGLISKV